VPAKDMPAAEVEVDVALVRALLEEQHPDLADRPLSVVANGWDNAMVRVGDDLAARLPRREPARSLIEHEQRWLPELAPRLPLPVPAPVRVGRPGAGYPWPWSIVPWFEGAPALVAPPRDQVAAAEALGRFLAALHQPAPPDAPTNPYRGVPLAGLRDRITRDAIEHVGGIDREQVRARWARFLEVPLWDRPPVWLHGDPHPGNVVVHEGAVSAVVDFGDITAGDPASDLAVAWMHFGPEARAPFRSACGGVDEDTWQRAHGWALALGLVIGAHSADNPAYAALAHRTIAAALDEPGP
jgi:aminoglycoside phosphotransferase (APT) family kinase protein